MNDTPGWASPGSAPSNGPDGETPRPAEPADPQSSKWSKEQPPAGQWSAPSTPVPGQAPPPPAPGQAQRPGWGGPGVPPGQPRGGWSNGWGGPPAAAKPGVIPLRPLGVGEILDGAVSTMRAHWRTVLGISLAVAVVTQIAIILLQGLVLNGADTDVLSDPNATAGELGRVMTSLMTATAAIGLVGMIGTFFVTALLTMVTSRAALGRSVTTAEAWRDARPQLPRLLGLTFLLSLLGVAIIAVGALPGVLVSVAGAPEAGVVLAILGIIGGVVVAVWILIRFSLSSPALMLEKQTIRKSMARSAKLVRGSWWRVFGIQLLTQILVAIVVSIVAIPFSFLAVALSGEGMSGFLSTGGTEGGWTFLIVSGIGSVIGSMITFPIAAGVSALLYIDLRIRREALDLELARAAGIQGYGSTAPGPTPGS